MSLWIPNNDKSKATGSCGIGGEWSGDFRSIKPPEFQYYWCQPERPNEPTNEVDWVRGRWDSRASSINCDTLPSYIYRSPWNPRWLHELYAKAMGYYWIPCKLCGRYVGAHETFDGLTSASGWGTVGVCPTCELGRRKVEIRLAAMLDSRGISGRAIPLFNDPAISRSVSCDADMPRTFKYWRAVLRLVA